jgi:hypothetical protein
MKKKKVFCPGSKLQEGAKEDLVSKIKSILM